MSNLLHFKRYSFNELIIDLFFQHYKSSAKIEEPFLGYMTDMLVAIAGPFLDDMVAIVAIVALDIATCIAVARN